MPGEAARMVLIDTPDKWHTFEMLVRTQLRDPLDFIRESVLNSFDAGATRVKIELIRDAKAVVSSVRISDNGVGAPSEVDPVTQKSRVRLIPDPNYPEWGARAMPDIEYIPLHAADSLKRSADRSATVGQFGIGLYTFWGLGNTLSLTTRAQRTSGLSDSFRLVMEAEKQGTFPSRVPHLGLLASTPGTVVQVDDLRPSARPRLSRDRVAGYLSIQLRERLIKLRGRVSVSISSTDEADKVVEPKRWGGRPWASNSKPKRINTRFGPMEVDLYLLPDDVSGETRVSATANGAYGYLRLTDIPQLNTFPWNTTKVQGNIDYPAALIRPSRDGFVPGKQFDEFVRQMVVLTSSLSRDIREYEKKLQGELDRRTQDRILRAFADAWSELDHEQYSLFKARGGRTTGNASEGLTAETSRLTEPSELESSLSLDQVSIRPASAQLLPNSTAQMRARAEDGKGQRLTNGVSYKWVVGKGHRSVVFDSDPEAPTITIRATEVIGFAEISVEVEQDSVLRSKSAKIEVVPRLPRKRTKESARSGVPPPIGDNKMGEPWHSRYDPDLHQIVYNSGHPDYARAVTANKKAEYILTAMAKELVLLNYPNSPPQDVLEMMVEVLPTVLRHY